MPCVDIVNEVKVERTPRVVQLQGIFDIDESDVSIERYHIDLPIEGFDWNVGVVVGPSGSGKSTLANRLWSEFIVGEFEWDDNKSVVDSFDGDINDIVLLLSSVGFSSPPLWLRPYRVLSNGEKFRVNMARALNQRKNLIVVDEFTSIVDRNVAKIGSYAISKTVRRREQKFIAVTCHYDVVKWLEADWVFDTRIMKFSRRRLRRPKIRLCIYKASTQAWDVFKKYHYLNSSISPAAQCFVGMINGYDVVFSGVLPFPHSNKSICGWRGHRTVCLPDYQGVGIGNTMSNYVASLYSTKGVYRSTTSHPAMISYRARSKNWKMIRKPSLSGYGSVKAALRESVAADRVTAGFVWSGKKNYEDAKAFGII